MLRTVSRLLNRSVPYAAVDEAGSTAGSDVPVTDHGVPTFKGYVQKEYGLITWYAMLVFSCGFAWLLNYWLPVFRLAVCYVPSTLYEAECVAVQVDDGPVEVETVHTENLPDGQSIRYFEHRHQRFHFDANTKQFHTLQGLQGISFEAILSKARTQVTPNERAELRALHGTNAITVDVPSYLVLLVREVLNPFYMFQVLAMILWCVELYFYFAGCVFVITAVSSAVSLVETRRNLIRLRDMAKFSGTVKRLMAGLDHPAAVEVVDMTTLVPGDIVVMATGTHELNFDAVILSGACVVNEAMLTGESVPTTKSAVPPGVTGEYVPETHKDFTIFGGTHILYCRTSTVVAMVARTGFNTSKGELVRSILHPAPTKFRFYVDSLYFIGVMFLFGVAGLIYAAVVLHNSNVSAARIVVRALDIVTLVVPPSLPAALAMGIAVGLYRLRKMKIFCTSPPRVNVAGKIKVCCFDKTGTLTSDGLEMYGVHPAKDGVFSNVVSKLSEFDRTVISAFATCHSLAILPPSVDEKSEADDAKGGNSEHSSNRSSSSRLQYVGDPMEMELFRLLDWELTDDAENDRTFVAARGVAEHPHSIPPLAIVKRFAFIASLRRMSVVVTEQSCLSDEVHDPISLFVKGAPEELRNLCVPKSLPPNYDQLVREYSQQGYRVIAMATRELPALSKAQIDALERDEVEKDLVFVCLILLQNKVKPGTEDVIKELRNQANLRCIMITGDNVYTACSVAGECSLIKDDEIPLMVEVFTAPPFIKLTHAVVRDGDSEQLPHFMEVSGVQYIKYTKGPLISTPAAASGSGQPVSLVIAGKDLRLLRSVSYSEYCKLIVSGTVFARMSPDDKAQLIVDLQSLGLSCLMCGDGANDCGALKAAHVGVSLSEAEASVAAPFTSQVISVECIPKLLREARASLTASFGIFKFTVLYSFAEFTSALILYKSVSNLGDTQYLFIDLPVMVMVLLMCLTHAEPVLSRRRPHGSLMAAVVLASVIGQIIIQVVYQIVIYNVLKKQSWFTPVDAETDPDDPHIESQENTTVFLFAYFQYISMAIIYHGSRPFRRPIYTNYLFVALLLALTIYMICLVLKPDSASRSALQLVELPSQNFKWSILGLVLANTLTSILFEAGVAKNPRVVTLWRRLKGMRYRNPYKKVALEIKATRWPNNLRATEIS